MALLMHLQCWWNLSDMIHLLSFFDETFFATLPWAFWDWLGSWSFFPSANQFFSINLFHLKTIWKVLFGIGNLNNLIQIQCSAFYLMGLSMARQYAPCLWPANQLLDLPRPLQIVCTRPVFNSRFNSMWASTCLIFNSQFKSLYNRPALGWSFNSKWATSGLVRERIDSSLAATWSRVSGVYDLSQLGPPKSSR